MPQLVYPPCKNPNCKNNGQSHPNCKCWGDYTESQMAAMGYKESGSTKKTGFYVGAFAKGGEVNYCSLMRPHKPDCPYYMADGGELPTSYAPLPPAPQPNDDIPSTIGMAAVHHGLLGLIKNVGHAKLSNLESHIKTIEDAQDQSFWHRRIKPHNPTEEILKKSQGHKLGDALALGKHEDAAELIHGSPLAAGASKANLAPIMQRLSSPLSDEEANPEAFRASVDYLNSSMQGRSALESHMEKMLGKQKSADEIKDDPDSREALKSHLDSLDEDPSQMLDVGGSLAHYLPDHSGVLSAHLATARNYLKSLKPMKQQGRPLDNIVPIDKAQEAHYNRQLDLAQNPLRILQHISDGTLQPADLKTVQSLYPGLHQAMIQKATEALITAKTNETEIPYKQKIGLSLLLGQPLDSTMTLESMTAIIAANGPNQGRSEEVGKPKKAGATAATQKAMQKVDELYETPLDRLQINRNS